MYWSPRASAWRSVKAVHSCNHHVSHIASELGVIISQRVSRGVKALGQLGARVHDRRVGRRLGLLQRGIGCHLGLFEALLSKRLRLCKLVVETRVLDRRDEVCLRRVDERRRCSTELLGLRLKVSDRFCSRGTSGGERVKNESCVDQVGEQATRRAQMDGGGVRKARSCVVGSAQHSSRASMGELQSVSKARPASGFRHLCRDFALQHIATSHLRHVTFASKHLVTFRVLSHVSFSMVLPSAHVASAPGGS